MISPAHRQYLTIKDRYPDAILLFRLGDFYEMFGEDAKVGASTLGITLTSREFGKGERVPMCGVPHHALQGHLKRFLQHDLKVAICEQLTEAGNGLVERDVVRVVTPGTLVEDGLLEARENNYLAAVNPLRDAYGFAYVDVTTGEFRLTEFRGPNGSFALEAELLRLQPSETLVPDGGASIQTPGTITEFDAYRFDPGTARDLLCRRFGVTSLEGFGCESLPAGTGAAGAIVAYVERTNKSLVALLTGLRTYQVESFMTLDRYTQRNLELVESARTGSARGGLLWVLDRTQTAMGGRLLRRMLSQPLLDPEPLNRRLDAVTDLVELSLVCAHLRRTLARIGDIERLAGRVRQELASARDLVALRDSLRCLPDLSTLLQGSLSAELAGVRDEIDPCPDICDLIDRAVDESDEMRLIRPGYSSELDEAVDGIRDAREWIARLEGVERERTGIRSLKVGYNKVFGYYIEVSNANVALAPTDYIRKQTLVNAERFITPELKEKEARILQAEDGILAIERRLFSELLQTIGLEWERLMASAGALAKIDVYRSLADLAAQRGYCRPDLETSDRIEIVGGRHPVVEVTLDEVGFIPNDLVLDSADRQILLITGPNMGGKSTYLRQTALIVLLAQIGSFVPAERARVGMVDRIFSRVGAQDDIASGQSTFMVEMVETANILNHATSRSLLVLDEVGRGTSTYDGLAIARAVVEHLHDRIGARTLFATHYHELTELADLFPRIHNVNVAVAEDGADVIFLHCVVPGGADRSYGIHVARLAGLPRQVTERAQTALQELEHGEKNGGRGPAAQQIPLFGGPAETVATQVLSDLLALDVSGMTPLEAITRLYELQEKGRGG
ncbi:MAG: DNA mismatch repair protein MutS [Chloroflexota bacterium]|nr:MAG: DNA mismatch repair protein MutS [Chloroflexota bacterium]